MQTHALHNNETAVLIIGGGPVGLTMALCLARYGVQSMLVERHPGTSIHPKARGITVRTMELLRAWGLHDAVRAVSMVGDAQRYVIVGRSLSDPQYGRVIVDDRSNEAVSPTEGVICSQLTLEPLLLEAVRQSGMCDIRFSTELVRCTQQVDSVSAQIYDLHGAATTEVRARYLIAADGGRSGIRAALGIEFSGVANLSRNLHILIEADLAALTASRPCRFFLIDNPPTFRGMVAPSGVAGRWLVNTIIPQDADLSLPAPGLFAQMVAQAVGHPIPFTLISAMEWTAAAQVAQRLAVGNVFLVGDAAHVTTPAGGFGMNMGIQAADNLAWKLAAVLQGWANSNLLASYEAERLPVARHTVAVSLQRLKTLTMAPPGGTVNEVSTGLVLGYCYDSAAIVPDGSPPPILADPVADYLPVARPGYRAPHLWLDHAGTHSTLDLFGGGFVLLTTAAGGVWVEAAAQARAATHAPLTVHIIGATDHDIQIAWCQRYEVAPAGAVLVRPDGFVCWRSPSAGPNATATLRSALRQILWGNANYSGSET